MTRYLILATPDADADDIVTVPEDDDVTLEALIAQTYTDSAGNLKPKYEQTGRDDARVIAAGLTTPGGVVTSLTLVSGTPYQDTTGKPSTVYVPITGAGGGTVKVEIGPDNTVANTIHPLVAANAVASQLLTIRLPANWWIKVTVATASITAGRQQV